MIDAASSVHRQVALADAEWQIGTPRGRNRQGFPLEALYAARDTRSGLRDTFECREPRRLAIALAVSLLAFGGDPSEQPVPAAVSEANTL